MGGNVFDDAQPVRRDQLPEIEGMLQLLFLQMEPVKVPQYALVGSALDESVQLLGDVDVVAQMYAPSDEAPFLRLRDILGWDNVRRTGSAICLRLLCPQPVQIDLFRCFDASHARWMMRGLWRHMLFALLARHQTQLSKRWRPDAIRYTMVIPDGLRVVRIRHAENNELPVSSTWAGITTHYHDPEHILSHLGLQNVRSDDVLTLWDLAISVAKSAHCDVLKEYETYVSHLSDKSGYDEAIQTIKKVIARFPDTVPRTDPLP